MSLWGDWIGTNFGTNWLSDGVWQHVVLTLASPADENSARLYINGQEVAISAATEGGTYNTIATKFRISTASDDGFVNNDAYIWWNQGFKGWMDSFRVYNRAMSAVEIVQLYNFTEAPGPEITILPMSRTVYTSQAAIFSVVAAGAGSVTYQWRKNGFDIPLATSATLNLASVNKLNEGAYDVVVTDDTDSIISEAAMLTVISPAIFTDPTSRSGYAGQNTTFNVIAAGTGTLTYQWRKNGVNIPTATSSSLTLSPLNYRSAAEYDVVVTDDFDSDASDPAELTLRSVSEQEAEARLVLLEVPDPPSGRIHCCWTEPLCAIDSLIGVCIARLPTTHQGCWRRRLGWLTLLPPLGWFCGCWRELDHQFLSPGMRGWRCVGVDS